MAQPGQPVKIFISYSHKDNDLRCEMMEHLSVLRRQGVIADWHDRLITAGEDWKGEIDEHLKSAHIVLLLVSSSFLNSDYCFDIEMKLAIERCAEGEAEVIPVILRDCDWNFAPLSKFHALPMDGKPVTSWENRDEAFLNVVRGIREAIKRLRPDFEPVPEQSVVKVFHRLEQRRPPLPYLCNRSEQEQELRVALQLHRRERPQRPIVCLIHGNENEAHGEFLDRLQYRKLPKFLDLDQVSVRDCEWQPPLRYLSNSKSLWRSLGDQLIVDGEASQEEVVGFISRCEEPMMICTRWLTESFDEGGVRLLADLLAFWNDWPDLLTERVIINFVSIKYQQFESKKLFGFLNHKRKFEKLNDRLQEFIYRLPSLSNQTYPNISVIVLPELKAISRTDAEAWTHDNEVMRFCRIHERQIRELYKERGDSPIAMDDLALEIERLMNLEDRVKKS